MPSLQQIRRRISSVKNTQQITKAMKMVAAAKLRRAQERVVEARPYAQRMALLLQGLVGRVNRNLHPMLNRQEGNRLEVLLVTADRGLCGGFNANLIRKAAEVVRQKKAEGNEVSLNIVGRKGRDFYRRREIPIRKSTVGIFDRLGYEHAVELGADLIQAYDEGKFQEVHLIYNEFKSAMSQKVVVKQLLPIEPPTGEVSMGGGTLFEPSEEDILKILLPRYIEVQIFHSLLESSASEQGARMVAMDSATRNARDMISKLTLFFNKARQAAITKELLDIVGGAEALK